MCVCKKVSKESIQLGWWSQMTIVTMAFSWRGWRATHWRMARRRRRFGIRQRSVVIQIVDFRSVQIAWSASFSAAASASAAYRSATWDTCRGAQAFRLGLHYITLHCIALHCIAYIHTYIHACMHACMHTYIHTYIYIWLFLHIIHIYIANYIWSSHFSLYLIGDILGILMFVFIWHFTHISTPVGEWF